MEIKKNEGKIWKQAILSQDLDILLRALSNNAIELLQSSG